MIADPRERAQVPAEGAGVLGPRAACAAPPARTAALVWRRGPGAAACADASTLARAVEERLGRRVFVATGPADVRLDGGVDAASVPGQWHATLALTGAAGEPLGTRELRVAAPICAEISAPLALIVALMLDPDLGTRADERPREPGSGLLVDVGGQVAFGILPATGWGLVARVGLARPHWPVIEARADLFLAEERAIRPGVTARFRWLGGAMTICPVVVGSVRAEVGARLCAGPALAALTAQGIGFDVDGRTRGWSAAALAELRGTWKRAGRVGLFAGVEALLSVSRPRYHYTAEDGVSRREVFRPAPLAARLSLGVAWSGL